MPQSSQTPKDTSLRARVPEKNAQLVELAERADRRMEKCRKSRTPLSLADLEFMKNDVHEAVELGHKARFLWLSADERADNLTARAEELTAELTAYRALDLGDLDGRVSASCGNPEHPTWLRAPDDNRGCPWCRIAEVRTEALAEAKDEVVEWLVKKAHEGTEVSRLADKVERGAIRLFFDAERSAAAAVPQHYDKVPDPADGCHWCACGNRWPCKQAPAVKA